LESKIGKIAPLTCVCDMWSGVLTSRTLTGRICPESSSATTHMEPQWCKSKSTV